MMRLDLNLILWFRWGLSVANQNWEVRLDLPIHKFANYQSYDLIFEVLFTIAAHDAYISHLTK